MTSEILCETPGSATLLERPRFFPRQLVTPDDLTLAHDYLRDKLRRMSRFLFGWGVVCGARVEPPNPAKPWCVLIQPGYILGPYGDEILLDRQLCFDLRTKCITAMVGDACSCQVSMDCTCGGTTTAGKSPIAGDRWIAIRYKEIPSRPVKVQPASCGCDDSHCEYSRWRDGYEICVLDACPASHQQPPDLAGFLRPTGIPDCPGCPSEPWVVLAQVTADEKGTVTKIDNCSCRRMVLSTAPYWWRCNEPAITPEPPTPPPDNPQPAPGNNQPG